MTVRAAWGAGPGPACGAPPAPVVVGVGESAVGIGDARLATYALGSCVGVALYDPVARVAGLLHAMLPDSAVDAVRAARAPAMFVDTGVPLLLRDCARLGARRERLVARLAGGAFAAEREDADHFRIGRRNVDAARALLAGLGVPVVAEDVGGSRVSRTLHLDAATGLLRVQAADAGGARRYAL